MEDYTINEIGTLLEIPEATIRYYEKIGIISPSRKLNGYRVFGYEDIFNLVDCRRYSRFGLPLKEIAKSYAGTSEAAFRVRLREYNNAQKREDTIQHCITSHVSDLLDTLEMMPLRGDDIYVKKIPLQCYVLFGSNNNFIHNLNLNLPGSQTHISALSNIKRIFAYPSDYNTHAGGYFIDGKYLDALNIRNNDNYIVLPEHYAFCKSVKIKELDEFALHIQDCINFVVSKGYHIADQIYANSLVRIRIDDTFVRYTEIEIPIYALQKKASGHTK